MRELKIGQAWIRGVIGDALTPEIAIDFACSFGTWCGGGPVVISQDSRRSSRLLREAVVAGLISCGCEVLDLGQSSTPLVSFAVREWGCAGGISITGSHNDSRWNALKFIGGDGALLNAVKSEELLDLYHAGVFDAFESLPQAPATDSGEIVTRYVEYLLSALASESIRRASFRVAVDFCNGPLEKITWAFLERLHCKLIPLNAQPTGCFPHLPAPSRTSMEQLGRCVAETGADLGAAFNIDGDRAGFVDSTGTPFSEEITLPLAVKNRLSRRPGAIVTSFSTSRQVDEVARRWKVPVIRTSVGESHVMDRALEEGAVLAGEGSGGVAAVPVSMTFDSLLTLGMVLESMALEKATLQDLVADLPQLKMKKGEIRCSPARAYRTINQLRDLFPDAEVDLNDGIRFLWDRAWLHVRVSSTEPLIRVIGEAPSESEIEPIFQHALQAVENSLGRGG